MEGKRRRGRTSKWSELFSSSWHMVSSKMTIGSRMNKWAK